MRISPATSLSRLKGATHQPMSTWPVMAWVVVPTASPVGVGFMSFNPYSDMKRSAPTWVEEPAVE